MTAKILIIDDHDDFRQMVKNHLAAQHLDMEIFEASSGELGIEKALREKVNIILMDIRLPNINGIDAATRIRRHLPECRIVVLTMFETEAFRKVFKSGDITAYIGKSELYDKLVPVIKGILKEINGTNKREVPTS